MIGHRWPRTVAAAALAAAVIGPFGAAGPAWADPAGPGGGG
jgi:hypothetical protein